MPDLFLTLYILLSDVIVPMYLCKIYKPVYLFLPVVRHRVTFLGYKELLFRR